MEVATGKVPDACCDRHRSEEFLKFLRLVARTYPRRQLHVAVDVPLIPGGDAVAKVQAYWGEGHAVFVYDTTEVPSGIFNPEPEELSDFTIIKVGR